MTAEEAIKVTNGSATLNQDGTVCESDTTKVDNMEVDSSATVEDKSNDKDNDKSKSTSDEIVSSVEDKDKDKDKSKSEASNDNVTTESNNNKKYTRAERQNHAFKVQRDKLKESKARIK